jgi:AAA family ATP:ADP antiporter
MTREETTPGRILSRALRPFAKVEASEAVTASVLTVTVFVLLTAYYLLKTAREPLILLHGGAEVKSYASAGQALLLLVVVPLYGALARRVGPIRLLAAVYFFFAANLGLFAILPKDSKYFGIAFYLWVGVFNYTSVAQFWSLSADIYTPEQGKRLFAILGIGSSLGAVFGALVAKWLVHLGPSILMLTSASLLVVCVFLLGWAARRGRAEASGDGGDSKKASDAPLTSEGTLKMLVTDRYLLLIAALTLLLNWVNSTGEYLLDRTLVAAVGSGGTAQTAIGVFKASYFMWYSAIGVVVQLFLVSRILQRFGVRVALFVMPVISLLGYGLVAVFPILALIRVAKIAENSIDYSLQNTARQALYLVCSRFEKYVGKAAVDTIFVRLGDVLTAIVVFVFVGMSATHAFHPRAFAAFNVILCAGWILTVVFIAREHRRRSEAGEAEEKKELASPELAAQ